VDNFQKFLLGEAMGALGLQAQQVRTWVLRGGFGENMRNVILSWFCKNEHIAAKRARNTHVFSLQIFNAGAPMHFPHTGMKSYSRFLVPAIQASAWHAARVKSRR
jgi:hypothetical protein